MYECSENVQLFFAVNALLRVEDHVTLTLRGSLRAGTQQIFGHSRNLTTYTDRPAMRPAGVVTWARGPNAGKVILASDRIPLVRPEWWGAVALNGVSFVQNPDASPFGTDSSEALQAAFDAASTGRPGQPPLPVMLEGLYQCNRTLEVRAPMSADGPTPVCLVLRTRSPHWHSGSKT